MSEIVTRTEQHLMDKYTIKKPCIVGGDDPSETDPHTVWLVVGNQSFCLTGYRDNQEEADWMRAMLAKALAVVIEETKTAEGYEKNKSISHKE